MRRAARLACGFLAALVVGLGLLATSSLLTFPSINRNIAESAEQLAMDPDGMDWYSVPMALDGFTDALKLNITYHDGTSTTARDSMTGAHYSTDPSEDLDSLGSLADRATTGAAANASYAKYWHGYLPFQRLLFTFFNLSQWRWLNAIAMGAALALTLGLVARRIGVDVAIGFAVTLALVAPHLIPVSLQFSPVFYLVLAGVCAVVALGRRGGTRTFDLELFGALGVAVAYFDLLTTPVLSLAIPLLVLLAQDIRNTAQAEVDRHGRYHAVTSVRSIVAWTIGYVGFWASKWVVNDVAFGFGDLGEQSYHTLERAGLYMMASDRWATLMNNVFHLIPQAMWPAQPTVASASLLAAGLAAIPVAIWGILKVLRRIDAPSVRRSWPILLVGLLPVAWILFAAEHTFIHAFFAFRVLWASLFAGWLWFCVTVRGTERIDETGD